MGAGTFCFLKLIEGEMLGGLIVNRSFSGRRMVSPMTLSPESS